MWSVMNTSVLNEHRSIDSVRDKMAVMKFQKDEVLHWHINDFCLVLS